MASEIIPASVSIPLNSERIKILLKTEKITMQ
jgi:hypothetical protein